MFSWIPKDKTKTRKCVWQSEHTVSPFLQNRFWLNHKYLKSTIDSKWKKKTNVSNRTESHNKRLPLLENREKKPYFNFTCNQIPVFMIVDLFDRSVEGTWCKYSLAVKWSSNLNYNWKYMFDPSIIKKHFCTCSW